MSVKKWRLWRRANMYHVPSTSIFTKTYYSSTLIYNFWFAVSMHSTMIHIRMHFVPSLEIFLHRSLLVIRSLLSFFTNVRRFNWFKVLSDTWERWAERANRGARSLTVLQRQDKLRAFLLFIMLVKWRTNYGWWLHLIHVLVYAIKKLITLK